jgi:DNA-binding transcriptional ArsR family regulator
MARLSSREILWNQISRTCFQDRVMPYAYWFNAITDRKHHEHKKVLDRSVSIFSGADFVRLLGDVDFRNVWQNIRDDVNIEDASGRHGKIILDSLWSMMMTGFAFCQHGINIRKPISKQLKATYLDISSRSSKSIYQVARDMNRPYSRVYADVKRLNEMGLVKAIATARDGKRVTLLSAA